MHEEEKMRKEIEKAHRHTKFATKVNERRNMDFNSKAQHMSALEDYRLRIKEMNYMRKGQTKQQIS